MVKVLMRGDVDFYALLGPVFGSRQIEKTTHDRFYDDEGKIWYVKDGQGAASVSGVTIKNFYAENEHAACAILEKMKERHSRLDGIVPRIYQAEFEQAGFSVNEYKRNFMEVSYEQD